MAHIPTDQELDQLRSWLKAKLPVITPKAPPPPSQELLELAWQAAKVHREYLFDQGYTEPLPLPLAASDGIDAPFKIDSLGGEWSVTRESIPGSTTLQLLRWRCREAFSELYEGRQIRATISGQIFDLGTVFFGVAEVTIPVNLDLKHESISITIEKIVNDE